MSRLPLSFSDIMPRNPRYRSPARQIVSPQSTRPGVHGRLPMPFAAITIRYVTAGIDYSVPGRLTDIGEFSLAVLKAVPADPLAICRLVPGLVLHPFEAQDLGLDVSRLAGREIRLASAIIRAVLALDPAALDIAREPERRLVGTCRTFVVLSCALLRTAVSRPVLAAALARTSSRASAWITGSPS